MRFILVISGIFLMVVSCTSTNDQTEADASEAKIQSYFPNFPKQQYTSLALGSDVLATKQALLKGGYVEMDEQPHHFSNPKMETEIVLPDMGTLNSFKVFLFGEEDRKMESEFIGFLQNQANGSSVSSEFSFFDFHTADQHFTITLFCQPEFIRLNFELKSTQ